VPASSSHLQPTPTKNPKFYYTHPPVKPRRHVSSEIHSCLAIDDAANCVFSIGGEVLPVIDASSSPSSVTLVAARCDLGGPARYV
jgi:hypothetical protein